MSSFSLFVLLLSLWCHACAQDIVLIDIPSFPSHIVASRASFGDAPGLTGEFVPVVNTTVLSQACNALPALSPSSTRVFALVERGNCTFELKARNVQSAGYAAMVVVNSDDTVFAMSAAGAGSSVHVPSLMVGFTDGHRILKASSVNATMTIYQRPVFDNSGIGLFFMAVVSLILGALFSSEPERADYARSLQNSPSSSSSSTTEDPQPPLLEEVAYIDMRGAVAFLCSASAMLVVLFYFIDVLIYMLIAFFAIAGATSASQIAYILTRSHLPQFDFSVQNILIGSINVLSCLYFAVASAFAIWWTIARKQAYAWVLQDLFGVAVLLMMQRSIRLPNIKISMTLLLCAFVYDIYWVFLSPLFFSESVMIKVATGGNTGEAIPMLLKVPRVNDVLGGYSLLGLGDVALPGLFVSFVLRFDYMKRTTSLLNSYFFISTVAYGVGLIMTYVGLALMKSGQPALLYLVPCLLCSVMFVAWRRNEIGELWEGPQIPNSVRVFNQTYSADTGMMPLSQQEPSSSAIPVADRADDEARGDVPLLIREEVL